MLELGGTPPFRFRAGQYLTLHLASESEPLPYSIASADIGGEPVTFTLAIGPGTGAELLAGTGPGAELAVGGPFGSFTLESAPAALLVGAGTGLAPLRAHSLEWLARPGSAPIVLLAGARTQSDLLWHDELLALARRHAGFRYEPVLSQPGPSWTGRRGRVQEHLRAFTSTLPASFEARVCGAVDMVASTVSRLEELGVARARIAAESY